MLTVPMNRVTSPFYLVKRCVACAWLGLACMIGLPTRAAADPVLQVKSGDASITHDADAGLWTIAAGGTTLTLVIGPQVDLTVQKLVTASGKAWSLASAPDTSVTFNGTTAPLGAGTSGFFLESAAAVQAGSTVRLDAIFDLNSSLRITRHYQATSGAAAFEVWTTFQSISGAPIVVSNINALQLVVPNGAVHWVTGLQGDNATVDQEQAFTLQSRALAVGETLTLGSTRRSSEQMVPWITIDGSPDEFFAGLMWSGAWTLSSTRSATGLSLAVGLPAMDTNVSFQPVDGPHALFGVVRGGAAQATAAVRAYIVTGMRKGKPLAPAVTYNTWFAYGTQMDEASLESEMTRVAALGTELFVVDAGWYSGTGVAGPFDFEAGLGAWQVDSARFPHGLKALTDYAHRLGMKFGIWMEPERVNLATVGLPALAQETWLATTSGAYGSPHAALICLGTTAGLQWMQAQVTKLIDAVQPDYLKWDNNQWVNCNRAGHDHGTTDGNFAQVTGLYQVLAALRARYPNLLIENVSGGGNRLDLGMLRYTDVAWMDDRTAPSAHVRHNIQGLSTIFPPAYLLSFVTDHNTEPLHNAADLPLYFRSRMEGALGLCFLSATLTAGDLASIQHEVAVYKDMRSVQTAANATLLTTQVTLTKGPAWDVLQEAVPGAAGQVAICAVQSDRGVSRFTIKPTGLTATTTYEVRSVDTGVITKASGSAIGINGIDVFTSSYSAAHIIILTPKP